MSEPSIACGGVHAEGESDRFRDVLLRPWQRGLTDELAERPDPRAVFWYHEPRGNVGKSFMASYLAQSSDAIVFDGCKKGADVAYAYEGQRIVVFDLHRSRKKLVDYEVIEGLKNGRLFSPKYHSKVKLFAVPHVVVFVNSLPDLRAMSADSWRLRKIGSDCYELEVPNSDV